MGDVNGDLNRRRGVLQGMDESPAGKIIRAEVPLAEMFGYSTDSAVYVAGQGHLFHGVRPLCCGAAEYFRITS